METDPVSETLCLLVIEFQTMDKVQKPIVNECCTPSSEPYREMIVLLGGFKQRIEIVIKKCILRKERVRM
jgi:hypothetical protein